jgi:hypothetical protein
MEKQVMISCALQVLEFLFSHTVFRMAMRIIVPGFYFQEVKEFSPGGDNINLVMRMPPVTMENLITLLG